MLSLIKKETVLRNRIQGVIGEDSAVIRGIVEAALSHFDVYLTCLLEHPVH